MAHFDLWFQEVQPVMGSCLSSECHSDGNMWQKPHGGQEAERGAEKDWK